MTVFKRHKLNENGSAEYRQPGSTVSLRCSEGLWDGEAPLEIHVTASNLAAVPEPKVKAAQAPKAEKRAAEPKATGEGKGEVMRAAIYARKSTEQRGVATDAKSVTRQVENAQTFAKARGWTVAKEQSTSMTASAGPNLGSVLASCG